MKNRIHINRLGYMIGMPKTAVCEVTASIFYLVDVDSGTSVYAGRLSRSAYDKESGDNVRLADFTDFNMAGRYLIRVGHRKSDVFEISEKPYSELKNIVVHGMYENRCGFDFCEAEDNPPVDGIINTVEYLHRQCHTEILSVYGNESAGKLDVSGGWHDNGTYSKNTSSVSLAAAHIIYSLKLFPDNFSHREKKRIESECRWGLDWMFKMQREDGGLYHKAGPVISGDFVTPEEDNEEAFVFGVSSQSTIMFTGAMAAAANYFSDEDPKYARKLKCAAEKSWLWLVSQPQYEDFCTNGPSSLRRFHTDENPDYVPDGGYMWVLCEMYSLTGDEDIHDVIASKYLSTEFSGFRFNALGGFAALAYLLCSKPRDRAVESSIRKKLTDRADRMWIADRESGYNVCLSVTGGYIYSSNLTVLSDFMCFCVAYLLSGEQKYLIGATDQISYIFGKNPIGISYMTGVGDFCCSHPYHRMSSADDIESPVRGMVVSGANINRNDDYSRWHIDRDTPPAKCYADNEYSFSTNEPSIPFATPAIFASAFYENVGRSILSGRISKPYRNI